jgi:hypothetical protein
MIVHRLSRYVLDYVYSSSGERHFFVCTRYSRGRCAHRGEISGPPGLYRLPTELAAGTELAAFSAGGSAGGSAGAALRRRGCVPLRAHRSRSTAARVRPPPYRLYRAFRLVGLCFKLVGYRVQYRPPGLPAWPAATPAVQRPRLQVLQVVRVLGRMRLRQLEVSLGPGTVANFQAQDEGQLEARARCHSGLGLQMAPRARRALLDLLFVSLRA